MKANWPSISDTEMEVLHVLWEQGPGTVRDIDAVLRRRGRRWAYTTILTLLHRLQTKGYVASDKSSIAYVFQATVTREKLLRRRLTDLAERFCEGMTAPLVLALMESRRFSAEEVEEFRRLLDELEARQSSKGEA
jgi:predicted transcriptional regulator